jgi:high affinity Mn2+ porin
MQIFIRWMLAVTLALPGAAVAQFFGSPAVPNIGPPTDALVPEAAAMQDRLEELGWIIRGQSTFILQGHPGFSSPYRGENSMAPAPNARNTFSTDLVLGRRLWQGAEVIVNPSITRGFGLSNSVGAAAFPNNEAFRLGSTLPYLFVPRLFFRQTVALGSGTVPYDGDPMRFNAALPERRITFTLGKISTWDVFDDNRYSHDPRTQFINWALVGGAAVDYAADARGFTPGAVFEYDDGTWGLRTGIFQVSRQVNGLFLDPALTRAWQWLIQGDRFWRLADRPGAVRLLYGLSSSRQSTWREISINGFDSFAKNPHGYRRKDMASINFEQEVADGIGIFGRATWNDGRTNNWMFTEVDRALSGGVSVSGGRWRRDGDTLGLATNIGWISRGRQSYLETGGIGFIVGDGRLNYQPEWVTELYYDARIAAGVNVALNYQFLANPAYNSDRGPIHLFALRLRTAF